MYFFDDGKYMFSAGRRPTLDPYPANLINQDTALSNPIAHTVNMEFDGFSFTINNSALPDAFSDYGTSIKFCAGRGYSANQGQYSANGAPYSRNNKLNSNLAGFILKITTIPPSPSGVADGACTPAGEAAPKLNLPCAVAANFCRLLS